MSYRARWGWSYDNWKCTPPEEYYGEAPMAECDCCGEENIPRECDADEDGPYDCTPSECGHCEEWCQTKFGHVDPELLAFWERARDQLEWAS